MVSARLTINNPALSLTLCCAQIRLVLLMAVLATLSLGSAVDRISPTDPQLVVLEQGYELESSEGDDSGSGSSESGSDDTDDGYDLSSGSTTSGTSSGSGASPTPTPTPTGDTSTTTECQDYTTTNDTKWHDSGGEDYGCQWYSETGDSYGDDHCDSYGDSYEYDGYTANEACCTCGGGDKTTDAPTNAPTDLATAPPTGSPTATPTIHPTSDPTVPECYDQKLPDGNTWHDPDGNHNYDCTWYASPLLLNQSTHSSCCTSLTHSDMLLNARHVEMHRASVARRREAC